MSELERCYQLLGVPPDASLADLQQAYKQLLRVWNPDRFRHDTELYDRAAKQCVDIDEAYAQLVKHLTDVHAQERNVANDAAETVSSSSHAAGPTTPSWWRVGDQLVAANGARIDSACIVCNRRPPVTVVRQKVTYVRPALYLLLFLGLIGWILIFALIRRGHMFVGLCESHSRRRQAFRNLAIGCLVAFASASFGALLSETAAIPLMLTAAASFMAALVTAALMPPVSAAEIRDGYVWLKGVSSEFLAGGQPAWPASVTAATTGVAAATTIERPPQERREPLSGSERVATGSMYLVGSAAALAVLSPEPQAWAQGGLPFVGALVAAVIGSLIVHHNYSRRYHRFRGFLVVAVLYSAVLAAAVYSEASDAKKQRDLRAAADAAAQVATEALETGSPDGETPVGSVVQAGLVPVAQSHPADVTVALRWNTDEEAHRNRVTSRLRNEQQSISLDGVLDPKQLTTVAGLTAGRATLKRFRQHFDRYERIVQTENERHLTAARALPLTAEFRKGFLEGVSERVQSHLNSTRRFAELQRRFAEEAERVIAFMEARIGTVELRGDTLYFETDEDADWYNTAIARIEKLAAEETELMRESAKKEANRRATLQHLAKELQNR